MGHPLQNISMKWNLEAILSEFKIVRFVIQYLTAPFEYLDLNIFFFNFANQFKKLLEYTTSVSRNLNPSLERK